MARYFTKVLSSTLLYYFTLLCLSLLHPLSHWCSLSWMVGTKKKFSLLFFTLPFDWPFFCRFFFEGGREGGREVERGVKDLFLAKRRRRRRIMPRKRKEKKDRKSLLHTHTSLFPYFLHPARDGGVRATYGAEHTGSLPSLSLADCFPTSESYLINNF